MSENSEPAIQLRVDPTNPGQFFACCGLLELADRLWGGAEGWFSDGWFSVATGGTVCELLGSLTKDPAVEVTLLDNGLAVKPLIAPLSLSAFHLTLDAWMKIRRDRGEVVAVANPPWNFWSGQQTSFRIWEVLRKALREQMQVLVGGPNIENLFVQRLPLSGRFGFDPGAAWNALDAGFSPDAQQIPVASSPAVELLAAVGIQRFRPVMSNSKLAFYYATWGKPLAPSVAGVASAGIVVVPPAMRFRGKVVSRGSYGALGYSTPLNGASNG